MTLAQAVLLILQALPVHVSDRSEPPADRAARLEAVATAIADASDWAACHQQDDCRVIFADRLQMAGILIEMGRGESGFSNRVQQCRCLRFECDPISHQGLVRHQARGLWQQHRFGLAAQYWPWLCSDVAVAAKVAAQTLAGAIGACGGRIAGGLSRYASGSGCVGPLMADRAKRAGWYAGQLRRRVSE